MPHVFNENELVSKIPLIPRLQSSYAYVLVTLCICMYPQIKSNTPRHFNKGFVVVVVVVVVVVICPSESQP